MHHRNYLRGRKDRYVGYDATADDAFGPFDRPMSVADGPALKRLAGLFRQVDSIRDPDLRLAAARCLVAKLDG